MSATDKNELKITEKEYDALNYVRGLTTDAHYMIILAQKDHKGAVLKGNQKTFSDLLTDLYDEVEYELSPKSRLKHISSVIAKIEEQEELQENAEL